MNKRTCSIEGCVKPHRARGLCGSHYNQHHQPNRHAKKLVPCVWCGEMTLKHSGGGRLYGQTCSDECRTAIRYPPQSPLPADHWARWYGKASQWPRYGWTACTQCGGQLAGTAPNTMYCSKICRWLAYERRNGVRATADIVAQVRQCTRCGDDYTHHRLQRTHCSDLCRDLDAAERGAYLHHGWIRPAVRIALYERDNYTCWLCGEPCDKNADPQRDNWSPTLDHVIPRSQGGTHEHSNLRTAHRWCNSIRSDSGVDSLNKLAKACG